MKKILVTGIGGGVGQGILRNLHQEAFDVAIIGTNTTPVSAGNHLCNVVHVVPFSYEPAYAQTIEEIVVREQVDLIIPSTDYETYYLKVAGDRIPAMIAASPAETTAMCLDKYITAQQLHAHGLPFARSFLPSAYAGEFHRTVVKPREGRGSRNIHVDPVDPGAFGDDYVVQEYLDGDELTTCFYVRRDGTFHGMITFVRELDQGNTARCEVVDCHDRELGEIIQTLISKFPFRGSCNLQTRVTAQGVVPFEINCRISGTNSIRSRFGFRDVAYTVQEYLFDQKPDTPRNVGGCAIRMMVDIIYPEIGLDQVSNRFDKFWIS
ncbi:carbamoyl-phosphate synthase large subunit [Luteimonas cucumeris]|uniref:Carbamoyl-phosphate synthase large subunit n=1 Tax=Luteimonas cucumeris TaxID=985012 RepID=A0A562L5L1_9GAMM|nr:ATP-grasp domain-containing protein [Luteimonas cucumeris]TWI02967.1 carbamoyl-phosphate synthase large subunit [Luteimonas cucumeris]